MAMKKPKASLKETLAEFRQRGQRAACCRSHAKVV